MKIESWTKTKGKRNLKKIFFAHTNYSQAAHRDTIGEVQIGSTNQDDKTLKSGEKTDDEVWIKVSRGKGKNK